MPAWTIGIPVGALLLLAAAFALPASPLLSLACGAGLVGAVIASVHHAEVVAHRVGEPLGALILALAVTIIEVALIVTLTLSGGPDAATLARDTIFSAVMIICNGLIGLCLLIGGLRHHEQSFNVLGANAALATLITLTTLSLVLPGFTHSGPGLTYSTAQLAFAAVASLVLWGTFVFLQTGRHRDYFLPADNREDENQHAPLPSNGQAWAAFGLLLLSLAGVIGLAKALSPRIEAAVETAGAPKAVIGVAIAILVLLPETVAAVRAARANRLQTSLNLGLGSALASIGLTIPAIALLSVLLGIPLALGLTGKDLVLLLLTFVLSSITLVAGRTHVMLGAVHLVVFAAFLFFVLVP